MSSKHRRAAWIGLLIGAVLTAPVVGQQAESARQSGLRERTEARLAQVDVSVRGSADAIRGLTAEDFELRVAGGKIEQFVIDRLCAAPPPAERAATPAQPAGDEPAAAAPTALAPTTFLLYFDQAFLTMAGRNQGLAMARDLLPRLLEGGNRALVVSSGDVVKTYADLTADLDTLLQAVDAVEQDPKQWDPTAVTEESRIDQLLEELEWRGPSEASALARLFQGDERWRAEKALRRFSMTLGRLADLDPPKVVVYFADRMRARPGEHYLSYFSAKQVRDNRALELATLDGELGSLSFDRVVQEANAYGARVYTVRPEGLAGLGSITMRAPTSRAAGSGGTRHITDAENSMASLARETGGRSFLHGQAAAKIAEAITADLDCVYVLSFDPEGLPRGRALPVTVRVSRDDVAVSSRGQVYLQNESQRLTSRLMAAFTAPDAARGASVAQVGVVPTGWIDGHFTALVQVAIQGSPLGDTTWDLGVSLLSRGAVRADASGRVTVGGAGTPVVFETEMRFSPGPYEIVSVAHDDTTDQVLTGKIQGEWPDLEEQPATVAPIALVQPVAAVFVRDGDTRSSGALGLSGPQPLRTDLPTAAVTLVCRAKRQRGTLRLERRLVGASAAEFAPMQLALGDERCAQIRDVIQAGTMTAGGFVYEVRVMDEDLEVAVGELRFGASGPSGDS